MGNQLVLDNLTYFQKQLVSNLNLQHSVKKGRCFNGNEKDRGKVVHLVEMPEGSDEWFGKSICGSSPGLRGNGWAKSSAEVNCPNCLKALDKNK